MLRSPLKLLMGLGLCSLGGVMLYVYFKNKDDEDELDAGDPSKSKTKKEIALRMVIPNDIVPIIVGRSGANLKIIEEKTGTVIRFREKDDNNQYCEIKGTPEYVEKAKTMMMNEIQRQPTVREEIFVPQSACGKIIGRCGESLQEICRKSLAKVSVDSGDRNSGSTRRVLITGNRTQVNIAKNLIEEKVSEDAAYRKSLDATEQKREPRRSPTNSVSSNHSSMVSISSLLPPSGERLSIADNEKPMEVYVSAIASPAKFWLQLVGPQSRELDDLVETMTTYYGTQENQAIHKIADPYLGQIVAALFKYDGKWYRAEIVGILPNEYNPRDVVLDLYFVDYGDSEYVAPQEVFELRTDFLTLRFQAIECYLAHVKPALSTDPDMWDQQTISKFEELTHVATWKKLVSRVLTYKDRPKGGNHVRREGSPIPGVELFDTSDGNEVNIAHALIGHGYALSDFPSTPESVEVLRLDGGNFSPGSLPHPASNNNSFGNGFSENKMNGEESKIFNQMPTSNGNLKLSNKQHTNGGVSGINGTHIEDLSDPKADTTQLINSEKVNGNNVVQSKSNFSNHNKLNNLLQS